MSAKTDDSTFERIASSFKQMAEEEIVIAPWLAMNDGEERLSDVLKFQLKRDARDLAVSNKDAEVFWIDIDLSVEFLERAFYETLLSTAAYLSYMRLGTLIITEEMVSVSNSLLRNYLQSNGSSALLSVYARILTYLNNQLLLYYGQVTERAFISGEWHRPWIDYSLEHELESAIQYGFMESVKNDDETFIRLTEAGKKLYKDCRSDLEKCGYIRQREQLMRSSNFTHMDDYENMMERAMPKIHVHRRSLLDRSGIQPNMHVLELGCGAGALTLNDGLFERVGPNGQVFATDPSIGMLERAKKKLEIYSAPNVHFQQTAAERIQFPDCTFDAVVGMLFLHFTDIPRAFQEIRRVLKPGGTFTTISGLNYSQQEAFLREWFKPIFTKGLTADSPGKLPDENVIPNIAGDYFTTFDHQIEEWSFDFSNIEDVVKFNVQAGVIADLNGLPWQARDGLFRELIERGYQIKEKYGPDAMRHSHKVQFFRGTT